MEHESGRKRQTTQYVLIASILSLTAMFAIWVFQREAEKTRETLQESVRDAAHNAGQDVGKAAREGLRDSVKEGVRETIGEAKKTASELPGMILDEIRAGQAGAQGEGGEARDRFRPQEAVHDLFTLGREAAKAADDVGQELLKLDARDEEELGRQFHEALLRNLKTVDRPDDRARLERAAEPFLKSLRRPDVKYTFTIIEDERINACSIPGGYIYVHTGLLKFAQSPEELQFVIGHEIGHVDLGHCLRQLTYAVRGGEFGGELTKAALMQLYRLYELGFSEEFEYAADEYAYRGMLKAGRTAEQALRFPERFVKHLRDKGVERDAEKPKSVPEALKSEFLAHFESHPPSQSRVDRLRSLKVDDPAANPDAKPAAGK